MFLTSSMVSPPACAAPGAKGRVRHCSRSVCGPQMDLCLQPAAAVLVKQGSITKWMIQSAAELGLESDSLYFAERVLSEAGAGRRHGSLRPGFLVASGCRRGVTEPLAKSCPWPRGYMGADGCGRASSSALSSSCAGLWSLAGSRRSWCGPGARANC